MRWKQTHPNSTNNSLIRKKSKLNQKAFLALRSLFRMSEIKESGFPEILLENEQAILSERLLGLSAEEILWLSSNFTDYLKKAKIESIIEDHHLQQSLEQFLQEVN